MTAASPQTMNDQPRPATGRILALDIMRGYFILLIASVHLHYYPSLLGLFDGRGQLWTSEAEGFFFISGLLIGIIRRRDITERGFKVAADKLWRRSFRLYVVSITLSVAYLLIGRLTHLYGIAGAKDGLDSMSDWGALVVRIVTMTYSYGWADFLNYYVAFLLISPFLLWLLARRMWPVVLGLVLGIWTLRWTGSYGALDPFMQWQVYFFLGAMGGFFWPRIEHGFRSLSSGTRTFIKFVSVGMAGTIYVVSMAMVFIPQHFEQRPIPVGWWGEAVRGIQQAASNHWYQALLVDGRLGLLRPLVWLVVFAGTYAIVRRFESHILSLFGWLLVSFGAHSLYAYIMQSMALFAVAYVVKPSGFIINSLIEIAIIALVWLAIRRRFLFAVIPR